MALMVFAHNALAVKLCNTGKLTYTNHGASLAQVSLKYKKADTGERGTYGFITGIFSPAY